MENNRINIAVAFWGINDEYQGKMCNGISSKLAELKNVNVSYFASFVDDIRVKEAEKAEAQIYALINFDFYDALIVIPRNFEHHTDVLAELINRAKEKNVPVFAFDMATEGCINLVIENENSIKQIINHVIEEHGARHLIYVGGLKGCDTDIARMMYFEDALKVHGLSYDRDEYLWARFYDDGAKQEISKFLDEGNELPDAFICANDSMAIGICWELESRGYNVPEDVIITGFDGIMPAFMHDPKITTVEIPYKELGYKAVDVILKYLKNPTDDIKTLEKNSIIYSHPDYYGSCGCFQNDRKSKNEVPKSVIKDVYRKLYMYEYLVRMVTSLSLCDNIEKYFETLGEYIEEIMSLSTYVCFNKEYTKSYDTNDPFLVDYTVPKSYELSDRIVARVCYEYDKLVEPVEFDKKDILPALHRDDDKCREYLFVPLHFLDRTLGYVAVESKRCIVSRNADIFNQWANFVAIAHDTVRERIRFNRYTGILEKLHKLDPLTQTLNRRGLMEEREKLLEYASEQKLSSVLLLIDLDDMKGINDGYGHAAGDEALVAVTESLRAVSSEKDLICRFGGDEFLLFGVGYTSEDVKSLCRRLSEKLKEKCDNELSFIVTVSCGYCIRAFGECVELEDMTAQADRFMYKNKRSKSNRRCHKK